MRAHLYFFALDHQPVLGELGQALFNDTLDRARLDLPCYRV